MSNWIVITADDLNDYQVGKIINAARTKALAAGQADPFLKIMPDIANRIRDDIRGCKSNRVSLTPNSIPPGLRSEMILLTIEAMQSRLPGVELDEGVLRQIKKADDRLKRVSLCEVPIEIPTDPEPAATVQSGGLIETAQEGDTGNSREDLKSL